MKFMDQINSQFYHRNNNLLFIKYETANKLTIKMNILAI